jgi:hypothetical protein
MIITMRSNPSIQNFLLTDRKLEDDHRIRPGVEGSNNEKNKLTLKLTYHIMYNAEIL